MILRAMDVDYLNQLPYGTTRRARQKMLLTAVGVLVLFVVGLAIGWQSGRLAPKTSQTPAIQQLAVICSPIETVGDDSPYRPARLDRPAPASFYCTGGVR